LNEASESALEERCGSRIAARRWMFGRLGELSQLVGFLRTMGRVAIVLLFVVEWCGFGAGASLEIWALLAAAASSIAVLWLFTSLLASSLARPAAEGLVVKAAPGRRAGAAARRGGRMAATPHLPARRRGGPAPHRCQPSRRGG
ncbi:MAG: hypothetical protein ACO38W_08295, partial [Phycisphaerales bacterium]